MNNGQGERQVSVANQSVGARLCKIRTIMPSCAAIQPQKTKGSTSNMPHCRFWADWWRQSCCVRGTYPTGKYYLEQCLKTAKARVNAKQPNSNNLPEKLSKSMKLLKKILTYATQN
jgi:hypothetical protein